ncbi:MAG: hypothetical protein D6760_11685 [Deltaproteobacteria bacterium]|nr:MAG: hypothetical protein D6760_11685 [Deltaproteobacteria bacterium]
MDDWISPMDERTVPRLEPAPRLRSLEGKRVTLLSISKPKSAEFLSELAGILETDYGALVRQTQKPTFAAPAPEAVFAEVTSGSDAVVEALAD